MSEPILNSTQLKVLLITIIILVVLVLIYILIRSRRKTRQLCEEGMTEIQQINVLNDYNNNLEFHLTLNVLDKVIINENINIYFIKPCCLQSDLPLTISPYSKFYVEILIIDIEDGCELTLGLAKRDDTCSNKPGETEGSIGYSSTNGNVKVYSKKSYNSIKYGKPIKSGDIIGLGFQNYTRQVYFTLNGHLFRALKFPLHQACIGDIFPSVYSSGKAKLQFNNGQNPFVYFINNIDLEFSYPLVHSSPPPYSFPDPPSY